MDRQQAGIFQAHDALGLDLQRGAFRRSPAQPAPVATLAQVERAFEMQPLALVEAHRRVAQTQVDACGIGDRDARVGVRGEAGESLVVFDRAAFPYGGQQGGLARTVGFLQVAAYAEGAVGQREKALVLRKAGWIGAVADQQPGIVRSSSTEGQHLGIERHRCVVVHHKSPISPSGRWPTRLRLAASLAVNVIGIKIPITFCCTDSPCALPDRRRGRVDSRFAFVSGRCRRRSGARLHRRDECRHTASAGSGHRCSPAASRHRIRQANLRIR